MVNKQLHPTVYGVLLKLNVKFHMKYFARYFFFSLALVAPWSHAAAPDPSLVGCWRAEKIVLYAQDGSKAEDTSGRCVLQFKEDHIESTCMTSTGMARTSYQYRIDRPNVYRTTMTGSTFKTDLIGATREYEYRVDGDRLVTVTPPQSTLPTPPAAAMRVESEATRKSCE